MYIVYIHLSKLAELTHLWLIPSKKFRVRQDN